MGDKRPIFPREHAKATRTRYAPIPYTLLLIAMGKCLYWYGEYSKDMWGRRCMLLECCELVLLHAINVGVVYMGILCVRCIFFFGI